jgi:hypothetical protein
MHEILNSMRIWNNLYKLNNLICYITGNLISSYILYISSETLQPGDIIFLVCN